MRNWKPIIIGIILIVTSIIMGCGGGPATGSVSGVVVFGVQPASLRPGNNYPVKPLNQYSANFRATSLNPEKIIKFRHGLSATEITAIVTAMGGKLEYKIYGTENSYVVTIVAPNVSVASFNNHPNIESIAANSIVYASQTPNDSLYVYQWGSRMMYFPEAWDLQKGESRVPQITVAVLDSGVRLTHHDLSANLIIPADICNFVNNPNSTDPSDDYGHGTHVAGIIDAVADNNMGIAGMAWNVKILPVKVLDFSGSGTIAQVIAGINYAVSKGAKVINLSLGGGTPDPVPLDFIGAVNNAIANDVAIIAAAGNSSSSCVDFPANYPGIIAVAALGPDGNRASYSNYGPEIFVCAPGGAAPPITDFDTQTILSTYYDADDSYAYMCGTSMAAPHIAGLVALLYSQNPNTTPNQVKQQLRSFVIDKGSLGFDNYYGYGMPDADAALSGKATRLRQIQVYAVSLSKNIEVFQYPDGSGNYTIYDLPPGPRYICAYLDKNGNGKVDSGDLFGYRPVTIQGGITISNINITLTDIQIINPAPSLAGYLQAVLPENTYY
jgi:serine protease